MALELELALAQIPTCQRDAFRLFHERSLSYADIASEMGCPIGTVKTWVHRARGKVIQQLIQRDVVGGAHPRSRCAEADSGVGR